MHQDIQTFSDLTAIETVGALTVDLEYRIHGHCIATVCVNDQWYIELGRGQIKVNLFDPISLKINLLDFKEGSSGIEIVNFSVNGLEILPKYQHLASRPTNYIDFYGEWSLVIPAPFYLWYHQITGQGWIA